MKKNILLCLLMTIFLFPICTYAEDLDVVSLSNCVDANSSRFMLGKHEIKIKFIGIDSTDIIYTNVYDEINGKLVSEYVCSILTDAKKIEIEYEPNSEKIDKYGRTLAWVFVDDVLLQEHLVKLGYSKVAFLYDNYKYTEIIKAAENVAKENKAGIWNVNEKETVENVIVNDESVEQVEEKGIWHSLVGFINEIFEKFLKFIDDLITNML